MFSTDKIMGILEKLCSVLSKRTGYKLSPSPVPVAFNGEGGRFHGVDAYFLDDPHKLLRFNILFGQQAEIHSVSFWQSLGPKPTYNIDLQGFSITQVVDQVADVITGAFFKYAQMESVKRRSEAIGNAEDRVAAFFQSDERILATLKRTKNIDDIHTKFLRWCAQNHEREINISGFKYWANKYLKSVDAPAARDVPSVEVTHGTAETYVEDAPDEADIFMNDILNNSLVHKFALLETSIQQVCDPSSGVNGAFVYGTGGSGKTRTITDLIKENGAWDRTLFRSGAVAGFTGLLTLLFKNRQGKIIVLDDNDDQLKVQRSINLLKIALNLDDPRNITYSRSELGGSRRGRGQDANAHAEESVQREAIDLNRLGVDFANDAGISQAEMIDDFTFKSKMIFISNLTKIPQPLADRTFAIELNFTKEDMLKLIQSRMEKLFTDLRGVTTADKEYVFNFMQQFKKHIPVVTFRIFKKLVSIYLGVKRNPQLFKAQAAIMIRSELAA